MIVAAVPAFAASFEESVAKFANDDFSDTDDAVGEIAVSGNPLAYPIISALQDERLMFDAETKKVYVKQADGKIIDAATAAALSGSLSTAALGGLTLLSPDVTTRLSAAKSVFKSHDEATLPTVDSALAKETNRSVKQALTEARAASLLF
ncbi:MAG: urea ABC transporter permease subunit UrtB, partial [Bradyrhizobium sp.]